MVDPMNFCEKIFITDCVKMEEEENKPKKRNRSENWSTEEKELLKSLVSQSQDVLEDKSNKTSVIQCKNEEWRKITAKFNKIMGKNRKVSELRISWKTIKLKAKSNRLAYHRIVSKMEDYGKPPSPTEENLEIMDKINNEEEKFNNINKNEDTRISFVTYDEELKKRQLEIMEEEHILNKRVKMLKIQKLELEISILENQLENN